MFPAAVLKDGGSDMWLSIKLTQSCRDCSTGNTIDSIDKQDDPISSVAVSNLNKTFSISFG